MTPRQLIDAARVPIGMQHWRDGNYNFRQMPVPKGMEDFLGCTDYSILCHVCMAGLHMVDDDGWGGFVLMEDSPREIAKHLPILVHGRGRILKTGLGMGCVVRGLLAKCDVEHIDVIEIDERVIRRFGPEFDSDPRVTIHHGDALSLDLPGRWDFAWHDIYCEGNDGLQVLHAKLLLKYAKRARQQGAWAFPRDIAARMPVQLLGAPKKRRSAA